MTSHTSSAVFAAGAALLLWSARSYFSNWGCTKDEARMHLLGDDLVRAPALQATEGISIFRPVAEVWPWLTHARPDGGALHRVDPQHDSDVIDEQGSVAVGDRVRLARGGGRDLYGANVFTVAEVVENQSIVLHAGPPDHAWETEWSMHLLSRGADQSRLLIRTKVALRRPGDVVLAEVARPAVSLTARGVLRRVRRSAEGRDHVVTRPIVRT